MGFKPQYIVALILLMFLFLGFTYQDYPFSKEDKLILQKAEDMHNQANQLLEYANDLSFPIPSDKASHNLRVEKKTKKIEKKIIESYLKAIKLIEAAFLLESSVYHKIIPQITAKHKEKGDSLLIINLIGDKAYQLFFKNELFVTNSQNVERVDLYQKYLRIYSYHNLDTMNIIQNCEQIIYYRDQEKICQKDLNTAQLSKRDIFDVNEKVQPKDSILQIIDGTIFKVQIAADRVELLSKKIREIYKGIKNIENFTKDGWFKYCVGEFKTFEDANEYRLICGVEDAFIIAFQNGKWINVLVAKRIARDSND